MNKELEISNGPVYLAENTRIFVTKGVPKARELEKILKLEDTEVKK